MMAEEVEVRPCVCVGGRVGVAFTHLPLTSSNLYLALHLPSSLSLSDDETSVDICRTIACIEKLRSAQMTERAGGVGGERERDVVCKNVHVYIYIDIYTSIHMRFCVCVCVYAQMVVGVCSTLPSLTHH